MIKVILFDADGVLINGGMYSNELERRYGITSEITRPFFMGVFQECLTSSKDLKHEIKPYLEQWGWEKSVQEFVDEWFEYEHKIDLPLINYIQKLRAQGTKCVVATNQEKYRADYMLQKMGFKNSFDKVYASAHLGARKPDQKFFIKLLLNFPGLAKSEILFWDDSPGHVTAAKQFGINAELYTTLADFYEKMKHYV